MIFIAIIIGLSLELLVDHPQRVRNMRWLEGYSRWIVGLFQDSRLGDGPVGVLSVLAVPFVLLWIIQASAGFTTLWLGFFGVVLGVLFLLYCLRYRALDKAVEEMQADEAEALSRLKDQQVLHELGIDSEARSPQRYTLMAREIVVQANERLFAVLFWFVLFGPAGALLYRMSWYLTQHPPLGRPGETGSTRPGADGEDSFVLAAYKLFGILSWIPARLTCLVYALAGGFEEAFSRWKEPAVDGTCGLCDSNARILENVGLGAMHLQRYEAELIDETETPGRSIQVISSPSAVKAARALVVRALLIWCVIFATLVLAVWVG